LLIKQVVFPWCSLFCLCLMRPKWNANVLRRVNERLSRKRFGWQLNFFSKHHFSYSGRINREGYLIVGCKHRRSQLDVRPSWSWTNVRAAPVPVAWPVDFCHVSVVSVARESRDDAAASRATYFPSRCPRAAFLRPCGSASTRHSAWISIRPERMHVKRTRYFRVTAAFNFKRHWHIFIPMHRV